MALLSVRMGPILTLPTTLERQPGHVSGEFGGASSSWQRTPRLLSPDDRLCLVTVPQRRSSAWWTG